MKNIFTAKFFARLFIIIIFLALIRTITEFFRLDVELKTDLTVSLLRPYMAGALLCSISAMVMVILNFFHKFILVSIVGVLTIAGLLYLKFFLF
jgi:hypothetical protein